MKRVSMRVFGIALTIALVAGLAPDADAKKKKKKQEQPTKDPYAEIVWPPPPDDARIKLERVIRGRIDVEAESKFQKKLLGKSPQTRYDLLAKPFAVDFDEQGRILVTDSGNGALIRFDLEDARMDVFGVTGNMHLVTPLGLQVWKDGLVYIADAGLRRVMVYDAEGSLEVVYGKGDELVNPTDVAVSPDGKRVYVTDSKEHRVAVFSRETKKLLKYIGTGGEGDGEFAWPTALAFDPEGNLLVVDQVNARVQAFDTDDHYLDQFGGRGVGFGNFVRPKDIAVDEAGLIYVTDFAFNNLQLFDIDFSLLTFVGQGGPGPGQFVGASGVGVHGDRFAVVDQMGARVQVFRFVVPKDE